MAFLAYTAILVLLFWVIYRLQKEVHRRQRIIEGQDELIRKQRTLIEERREHSVIISEQIQKRDEIIEAQKKLIEEKMTEKVKEAFEKPKRPRGRPRKNV